MECWKNYIPTDTESFLLEPVDALPVVGYWTNWRRNKHRPEKEEIKQEIWEKFCKENVPKKEKAFEMYQAGCSAMVIALNLMYLSKVF